jgi:hypothetical protein
MAQHRGLVGFYYVDKIQWQHLQHQVNMGEPASRSGLLESDDDNSDEKLLSGDEYIQESHVALSDDIKDCTLERSDLDPELLRNKNTSLLDSTMDNHDAAAIESSNLSFSDDNSFNMPHLLKIVPQNVPVSYSFQSFYYNILHLKWPHIISLVVLGFVVINCIFASLYCIAFDDVFVNPEIALVNSKFEMCLYLSVQTIATIGYGSIGPKPLALWTNFCVSVEACLGLMFVAIFTGTEK